MKSILARIIILIAILSIPTYFIYRDYSSSSAKKIQDTKTVQNNATTTQLSIPIVKTKIIPIVAPKTVLRGTIPNLDKKWSIPESYSADAKIIINKNITDLTRELKANNDQYDKWITLGNTRKLVGDYDEARNIWEFTSRIWPDGLVAYHNLGDLYGSYLKDKIKAETNMLKVIEIDPHYIGEYISLYHLYEQQYGKQDSRAVGILTKGLGNNSQSVDIMIALGSNYRDLGDKVNARKYYEMAIAQAKVLGNLKLQAVLETELSNL